MRDTRFGRFEGLVAASLLVVLVLAFVGTAYARGPNGSSLARGGRQDDRPTLLAFGDSVAAGYGLGPSGPDAGGASDSNRWTYSHLLAADLGWADRNFAVEGASSGVNGVLTQICQSLRTHAVTSSGHSRCATGGTPISPPPRLITITVGADDIHFSACLISALLGGLPLANPCAGAELSGNLESMATNVAEDLTLLRGAYPRVPILLTGYYNPLGSGNGPVLPAACPLVSAAVLTPLFLQSDWWGVARYAVEWYAIHKTGEAGAAPAQNADADRDLSAFSRRVLSQLNETLANVAARVSGVSFFQPNFGSRGLCSASPLVFEPVADATVTLNAPVLGSSSVGFHFGTEVCPGPKEPLEKTLTKSGSGTVSLLGSQVLHYSYRLSSNCVPHPTEQGQAVMAQEMRGLAERLTA